MITEIRAVDLVLLVLTLEALVLGWRALHEARLGELLLALAPGVCLVLALRVSLGAHGWPLAAFFLLAALPCHLADLIRRGLLGRAPQGRETHAA